MDRQNSIDYNKPIAIYDGECGMCSSFVQFVLKHEKNDNILFTPLDSQFSKSISTNYFSDSIPDSIIYLKENQISIESNAVVEISKQLKWPYSIFQYIVIIPRPIRDFVYRLVAKHRKRIFDSSPEACMIDHSFSSRIID